MGCYIDYYDTAKHNYDAATRSIHAVTGSVA